MRITKGSNWDGGSATNIIITSGICCTFIGISYGLYSFDVEHMENNLGSLIDGIKTAFIPSALAISIALLWKLIEPIILSFKGAKEESISGATIDDLAQNQHNQTKLLDTKLQSIDDNIVLGFNKIEKSFNQFAEKVAENNSQSLIEALNRVMQDFNTKINEQFGENFKHLDEAVRKLLEWQDRYGQELDKKISFFEELQEQLRQQAQSYEVIVKNSESFERSASNLSNIIQTSNQQQEHLALNLKELSQLSEKLSNDIPQAINQVEGIRKVSQELFETMKKREETMKKRQEELFTQLENTHKHIIHETSDNIRKIYETSRGVLNKIQQNQQDLTTNLNDMYRNMVDSMKGNIENISKEIEGQTQSLQTNLEKALNKSLLSLGSNLASLSEKFANDYTPLTERLKEVLEIARRSQGK